MWDDTEQKRIRVENDQQIGKVEMGEEEWNDFQHYSSENSLQGNMG